MDSLIMYHADADGDEIGTIDELSSLDMETNIGTSATVTENTFSLTVDDKWWEKQPIEKGHMIYIPDSEWGGIVSGIEHTTAKGTVTVTGITWRGLLHCIVIEPSPGEAYVTITNMEANHAITAALNGHYAHLIDVSSEDTGVYVSASWRYKYVAKALNKTLADYGLALRVSYNNVTKKIQLSAEPVDELTETIELSQDYGVDFTSKDGAEIPYNHCIALGTGELEERMVRYLYYDGEGITTTKPQDWDEADQRSLIFEYPNAESEDELISSATDRLKQYIPVKSIEIDQVTANVPADLGDIIGARDRLTGMVGQSTVTQKILTIKNGTLKISLGVE